MRVIVRCTTRLLQILGERPPRDGGPVPSPDDWYANVLAIDRRTCLLLMHAQTLFPVFAADVRTAQLRSGGRYFGELITGALAAEGLPASTLGVCDEQSWVIARTASRQVLGFMNDAAHMSRAAAAANALSPAGVTELNHRLRRSLNNRDGYSDPLTRIAERVG